MAIIPNDAFPGKTAGVQPGYPLGQARNISIPGDGTGSPWDQLHVNDVWGMLQSLLDRGGIVANGTPDSTLNTQYLDALDALYLPVYQGPNQAVNGGLNCWQEFDVYNFNGAQANQPTADMWWFDQAGGSTGISKNVTQFNPLTKFGMFVNRTVAGGAYQISHRTEGVRTNSGATISVYFKIELVSGANLVLDVFFNQYFGTGGSPSLPVEVLMHTVNIAAPDTQVVQFTFDIPSIIGKTIGTNNDDYFEIAFKANDAVQLFEIFQFSHIQSDKLHTFTPTPPAAEVANCQRYYQTSYEFNVDPGSVSVAGLTEQVTTEAGINQVILRERFATQMHKLPILTAYSPVSGAANNIHNYTTALDVPVSMFNSVSSGQTGGVVTGAAVAITQTLGMHWTADARLY